MKRNNNPLGDSQYLQIIVSLLWRYFFIGRKVKYSKELKLEIVKKYLKGESATALVNEYKMPKSMDVDISRWAHRYDVLGATAFDTSTGNKSYSKELKNIIIKEYLLMI